MEYSPIENRFQENLEKLIQEAPKNFDKIQQFIQDHEAWISKEEAVDYLPQLKMNLIQAGGAHHTVIETINTISNNLLRSDLEKLSPEILLTLFTFLGSKELAEVASLPRDLKSLNLSSCKLTDAGLRNLPPDLELLDLSCCLKLTIAVIENLPRGLKSLALADLQHLPNGLKSLNISFCSYLTNFAITHLPNTLQTLILHHSGLTKEAVNRLHDNKNIKFLP